MPVPMSESRTTSIQSQDSQNVPMQVSQQNRYQKRYYNKSKREPQKVLFSFSSLLHRCDWETSVVRSILPTGRTLYEDYITFGLMSLQGFTLLLARRFFQDLWIMFLNTRLVSIPTLIIPGVGFISSLLLGKVLTYDRTDLITLLFYVSFSCRLCHPCHHQYLHQSLLSFHHLLSTLPLPLSSLLSFPFLVQILSFLSCHLSHQYT